MKIAINLRLLRKGKLTGIGLFEYQTAHRIAKAHPEHTFYFLLDSKYPDYYEDLPNIIPVLLWPKSRHRALLLRLWFEFLLAKKLSRLRPDIFVSMDSILVLSTQVPTLLVLHDANFEHNPSFLPKSLQKYYKKHTPLFVQKATRIAAVSEFTQKDLIHLYKVDPDKIDVVYNGADNKLFKKLNEDEKRIIRKNYAFSQPFLLFVGSIHPRKNILRQLQAFDLYRKTNRSSTLKFLIIGDKWNWRKEEQQILHNLTYKHDILFLGRLGGKELAKIMASAEALMFVSLFEGFGVPILEGFHCEVPVITGNTSSMPEVAGEAAICVNPLSITEISDAIQQITSNRNLRKKLIEEGNKRKEMFSWDLTSELLWKSIEKTYNATVVGKRKG